MTKLSVVIITFNEERNIEQCLRSVKPIADEIIVVDSLSTDRTKEIAIAHGAIVIDQVFLGFIEQKNLALSKASNPYVMSLDADEAISEELSKLILAEKSKGFPKDAYSVKRLPFYCGKWIRHGTYYPDKKIRLVNKEKAKWGGTNPHDKIILLPGSSLQSLKGDLHHYIYQSFEEHMLQTNKFSSIAAMELFKAGKKPSYFKLIANPTWAFIYGFFIRLGFLDGFNGFMIAKLTAMHAFFKYAKHIQLYKNKRRES
jgi:glycosyltransferase involved in cell wall biosynthesis